MKQRAPFTCALRHFTVIPARMRMIYLANHRPFGGLNLKKYGWVLVCLDSKGEWTPGTCFRLAQARYWTVCEFIPVILQP